MAAVSAVVLFFLLASPSIVLSLFTVVSDDFKTSCADVPKICTIVLMFLGFIAMLAFLRMPKQKEDTGMKLRDQHTRRHFFHSYVSLVGITTFYFQGIVFDINSIIGGFDCQPLWSVCDNGYVIRYHVVDLIFYFVRPIFMGLECAVCGMMVFYSFAQTARVTYSVAIVQAANIAICFQAMVSESYHHQNHDTSLEINFLSTSCWRQEQNNSWSDCPTPGNDTADSTDCCWPKDNPLLKWLEKYNPLLYPVIIEFSLLIGEVMLGKMYERRHTSSDDTRSDTTRQERVPDVADEEEDGSVSDVTTADNGSPHQSQYLPSHLRITPHSFDRRRTLIVLFIIFPVVSSVIGTVIVYKRDDPNRPLVKLSETPYDWFVITMCLVFIFVATVYLLVIPGYSYNNSSAHISGLDYLSLFASAGSLLLITRRLISSLVSHSRANFIIKQVAEMGQVCVQVVFLYKTVYMDSEVVRQWNKIIYINFMFIALYASTLNMAFWSMNSVNPRESYVDIDQAGEWGTFDAIVGPLNILFRFSSLLIFVSTYLHNMLTVLTYLQNMLVSLKLAVSLHLTSSQNHTRINVCQGAHINTRQDDLSESHSPQEPDHRTASDITAEVQVHDVDDLTLPLLSASLANSGGSYGTMNEDAV